MIMKRYIILASVIMSLLASVSGQTYNNKLDSLWSAYRMKRGNTAFDNMRYLKASKVYSPLHQRGVLTNQCKSNLAQSYLNIAMPAQALEVFRSMDSLSMTEKDVYLMSQTLKLNAQYDESDLWMASFEQMKNNDTRLKWQSNNAEAIEKIYNRPRYKIELAPFNSSESDFGAFRTDGQVLFSSARKVPEVLSREYGWKNTPYLNVFTTTMERGSNSEPKIFSPRLRTAYHDGPVSFSADGNQMFVTQNPYKFPGKLGKKQVNNFRLLVSSKQANGEWGPLELLPFNGNGFSTGHATLSPDQQTLWFASDRPGGMGGSDIYYVTRQDNGWSEPVNAGPEINTEGDEMFPFQGADGRLYFSSNGHLTLGGLDICIAFKTSEGYKIRNMGVPINSTYDDFALFLNSDATTGYFASNRDGGVGDDDIYTFEITDPVLLTKEIHIVLSDSETKKIIPQTALTINNNGKEIPLKTNDKGEVVYQFEDTDKLTASAAPIGYKPTSNTFMPEETITYAELFADPIPVWGVYGTVTDMASGLGVDSIQVLIQPVGQRHSIGNLTLDGGTFRNQLEPQTDYIIIFSNSEYFTKRGTFTTKGRKPGWINVNEFMDASIEKVEVNKVIEIPNIYYDLGKWNIRKDAAVELDKVVTFMNDNPNIIIELGSHTDSRGSATSNQTLSQKRAQSAVDYIITKGNVSRDRITAKGYGESMLKNHCADGVSCSEAEHQQNRRTEIRIVGVK